MAATGRSRVEETALREEMARQLSVLEQEKWLRLLLTAFAYLLCAAFVPWPYPFVLGAVNLLAEWLCSREIRLFVQTGGKQHYFASLAANVIMGVAFAAAAGTVWVIGGEMAKAFAVGMLATTLIHLTTVRAIHLPSGFSGLSGLFVTMLAVAGLFWLPDGNWLAFGIASVSVTGSMAYAATAMTSGNALHRAAAEGQARAQAASDAKDTFLARMSHELRTPLNAIIGLSEAEAMMASHPQSKANLTVVTEAARALSVVLDDVLDMSAIRAGQLPVRSEPADPAAAIQGVASLFRPMAEARGLAFVVDVAPSLPPLAAFDPIRLRQCLSNLLSNAIKHTTTGSVELWAECDQGLLWVDVKDSGSGIAPGLRETIFEPFRRGNSTVEGTGLGLSISRGLARMMGGDLVVLESAPRRTTFRLTIALPAVLPAALQDDMSVPAAPLIALPDLAGRRVLVVDDIATNRLVAASHLRQFGAEVLEVSGGPEALAFLATTRVDLVILDMNMPGMDGIATLTAIRDQAAPLRPPPILAMTAVPERMAEAQRFLAEVDGVVSKPFRTESLAAEILRVLSIAT